MVAVDEVDEVDEADHTGDANRPSITVCPTGDSLASKVAQAVSLLLRSERQHAKIQRIDFPTILLRQPSVRDRSLDAFGLHVLEVFLEDGLHTFVVRRAFAECCCRVPEIDEQLLHGTISTWRINKIARLTIDSRSLSAFAESIYATHFPQCHEDAVPNRFQTWELLKRR